MFEFVFVQGKDGVDGATPIILLILDDEHAPQMRTAGEEVKARGADVIVITDNPKLAEVRKQLHFVIVWKSTFSG